MDIINIVSADNRELLTRATEIILNSYLVARVRKLPSIDPDVHYEHREAKIIMALFDGVAPYDTDFTAIPRLPLHQRPKYYNDITDRVHRVCAEFKAKTGKSLDHTVLSLRERAIFWQLTISAANAIAGRPMPVKPSTSYR